MFLAISRFDAVTTTSNMSTQQIFMNTIEYVIEKLPILFLMYLIIELLTTKTSIISKTKNSPLTWASLSLLPQCGFSVLCADMYNQKTIATGTLVAVFIATSDEFLPVIITESGQSQQLLLILGIKFVYAVILGNILNRFIFKDHDQIIDFKENHCKHNIFIHALQKVSRVAGWLFVTYFVLEMIFTKVDNNQMREFLMTDSLVQPIFAGILGLIPNCCISIVIGQLFLANVISIGSTITALSCATGFGYVILFKHNPKNAIKIMGIVYITSVFLGCIVNIFI